jgi:hypothetical protein
MRFSCVSGLRLAGVSVGLACLGGLVTLGLGLSPAEAQPTDKKSPTKSAPRSFDGKMLEQGGEIVQYLKKHPYHDVGVLKFRVQYPGKQPSFAAGALNVNMAERLENALILNLNDEDKIRVIHDAGNVVAKSDKNLTYLNASHVKKMFALDYTCAWGNQKVRPDVFLTGLVRVNTDAAGKPKSADVSINAVDLKGQWAKVASFSTSIDSALYADLGRSRRSKSKNSSLRFDDDKVDEKDKDGDKEKDKEPDKIKDKEPDKAKDKEEPDPAKNPKDSLVRFTVFYGDRKLEPYFDPANPGKETLEEPKEGKLKVRFKVQSQHKENLGLVLLVNGLSTLDRELKKEPRLYRMWILEPDKEYDIEGHYLGKGDGGKFQVEPFRTFSDEEWDAMAVDLPEPGLIQMMMFVSKKTDISGKQPKVTDPSKGDPDADMKISNRFTLRGLSQTKAMQSRQTQTLAKLKYNLNQASNRVVPRGGFGPGDPGFEQVLEYSSLPNPVMVEQRFIQFWIPRTK